MELLGITVIIWVVGVVAAVMLFLMPFFVFKIRNEVVEINEVNKRMLVLLESVIPESKKPKPRAKPQEVLVDGQLVRVCPKCETKNDMQNAKCSSCKATLITY